MKPLIWLALALLAGCGAREGIGENRGEVAALLAEGAPQMLLRWPSEGRESRLIAAGTHRGVTLWRSLDNRQIATERGIILSSRGFGADLMSSEAQDLAPALARLAATGGEAQILRQSLRLDGEGRSLRSRWECRLSRENGGALVVREHCRGPEGEFTNLYWLQDGNILRSYQFITPEIGSVEIEFLPNN